MPKSAILGGAALAVGLLGSSGAWAQCTDNFNYATINAPAVGQVSPISVGFPLGTGSSLSALTSTINTVNTAFLTTTSAFVSAPGNPQPDQQGGGAWGRVISGTVDTDTTSTGTLRAPAGFVPATGTQTCHTTTRQDYWGYQVGHDISILNGGGTGANWHWGVTAGYFEAKIKDITPAGSYTNANFPAGFLPGFNGTFNTPAGSLSEDTQVPFVGIYTAFTKGGLFLDGQARWDFFQNKLTDVNNGLSNQALDARGFSLTGNAGYNIPVGGGWFIEPSGGVVWSHVKVDPLNVAGVQQTNGVFFYARGNVTVDDIDSVLGRASLRVGTNFTTGGIAWQPFFTASVFHEFAGDVTARSTPDPVLVPGFAGFQLTTTSTGGVGTYGQFALGTAAAIVNTGWLGYARVDYRIGEDIEGWSVNAGLRYQFTPGQRGSIKDAPTTVWDNYNWSGFYFGGSVGTAWGYEHWVFTDAAGRPFNPSVDVKPDYAGYLLGGQAGYNVQVGKWVFGIEGDYGWTRARGGVSCPNRLDFTCGADVDQLGSLTGRVGYAWGRALLYGKAGWATAEVAPAGAKNINNVLIPLVNPINESKRLDGYTYGGGMEFALTNHVSAKAEWMHYNLGADNYRVSDGPEFADISVNGNAVRIGLNFHFGSRCCDAPLK